jgi:hypothetical protein
MSQSHYFEVPLRCWRLCSASLLFSGSLSNPSSALVGVTGLSVPDPWLATAELEKRARLLGCLVVQ